MARKQQYFNQWGWCPLVVLHTYIHITARNLSDRSPVAKGLVLQSVAWTFPTQQYVLSNRSSHAAAFYTPFIAIQAVNDYSPRLWSSMDGIDRKKWLVSNHGSFLLQQWSKGKKKKKKTSLSKWFPPPANNSQSYTSSSLFRAIFFLH